LRNASIVRLASIFDDIITLWSALVCHILHFSDQTNLLSFLLYHLEGKTNTKSARKRDDKIRKRIVNLVRKLPSKILKKLVSKGDLRKKDVQIVKKTYMTAFTGFININELITPGVAKFIGQMEPSIADSIMFKEFI